MKKNFNTIGPCIPEKNYMVNIDDQLSKIKQMIDQGKYFAIHRSRLFGKTTMLILLKSYLKKDYQVIFFDFQYFDDFHSNFKFIANFLSYLSNYKFEDSQYNEWLKAQYEKIINNSKNTIIDITYLFEILSKFSSLVSKPIVFLIDEVDNLLRYDLFIEFLEKLKYYYTVKLSNKYKSMIRSIVLVGVRDFDRIFSNRACERTLYVDNIQWNSEFISHVDLSLNQHNIEQMICEYKEEQHLSFEHKYIAEQIYAYTFGYPFLVSKLCEIIDSKISLDPEFGSKTQAWTQKGVLKALDLLLCSKNYLFESLNDKLERFDLLNEVIRNIVFLCVDVNYDPNNEIHNDAIMYGFLRVDENKRLKAFNRIFEIYFSHIFKSIEEIKYKEN